MPAKRRYSAVESAHCLKVQNLVSRIKDHLIEHDPDIPKDQKDRKNGSPEAQLLTDKVGKELEKFEVEGQKFKFTNRPNKLGGVRWYAHCPKCGKVSLKLYKPVKEKSKEQAYYCKTCHNLKSLSALHGPTKMYKEVLKPLRRLEKLKQELDKKFLTEDKKKDLLDEYDSIKKKLSESTEYRHYKYSVESKAS
jgi:hypothetical protein